MATESSRLERGRLSAKTHRLKKKNEINIMRETLSAQKVRIDQLETQTEKLQQQNDYLTKHIDWLNGGVPDKTNEALIQIEQHANILIEKNKAIAELDEKVSSLEVKLETLKKQKNAPQKRPPSISVEEPPELSFEDRVASELLLENAKLKNAKDILTNGTSGVSILPSEIQPRPPSWREESKPRPAVYSPSFRLPILTRETHTDNTKHERLYSLSECSSNSNKTMELHDIIDAYEAEMLHARATSNEPKPLSMSACSSTDTLPLRRSTNPLYPSSKVQRKRNHSGSRGPYVMEERPEKRRLDRDLLKRATPFVQKPLEGDSADSYWDHDKDEWPSYR